MVLCLGILCERGLLRRLRRKMVKERLMLLTAEEGTDIHVIITYLEGVCSREKVLLSGRWKKPRLYRR